MKKIFLFTVIVASLFLFGCGQEPIIEGPADEDGLGKTEETVVTFTATMPAENNENSPGTRIALEQNGLDVKLTWQVGDQLQIYLKYGDGENQVSVQTPTVTNIREEGKKADFSVTLPDADYTQFNLYGVYGGGGLDPDDPAKAMLPTAAASAGGSLEALQNNKAVMLTFAKTGISKAAPDLSVNFAHIGSLFSIRLENTGTTPLNNISKARLVSASTEVLEAHINSSGSGKYDITSSSGAITGTTTGTSLLFELPEAVNLAPGGVVDFWGWYIPVDGEIWPEMKLEVIDTSDDVKTTTDEIGRDTAPTNGKAFYFKSFWNGTDLSFTLPDLYPGMIVKGGDFSPGSERYWTKVRLLSNNEVYDESYMTIDDGSLNISFPENTYVAYYQTIELVAGVNYKFSADFTSAGGCESGRFYFCITDREPEELKDFSEEWGMFAQIDSWGGTRNLKNPVSGKMPQVATWADNGKEGGYELCKWVNNAARDGEFAPTVSGEYYFIIAAVTWSGVIDSIVIDNVLIEEL